MIKVAIDFKKDAEKHIEKLKNKGFTIGKINNKSIWVFDINYIYCLVAPTNDLITKLELEGKNKTYSIDIKDMEYFEIHSEKE